jgi:UDP:flavonoid glycosyltransferase YjiC (YdhE family)
MNSVTEATGRGVPLICIPLFAEQKRNAVMVKYRKVGLEIRKEDLIEGKEKLVDAIKTILNDNR